MSRRAVAGSSLRRAVDNRCVKKLWFVLPGAAFVALLTAAVLIQGGDLQLGDPAPAFVAPALSGEGQTDLADLRGKPVVLNFWASWCKPCEEEAALFREANDRYSGRAHIVGINIRDARSDAVAFVAKHDLDFLQVRDEGLSIYDDYGLTGQPETFFLDQNGVLIDHVPGPVTSEMLFSRMDLLVARDAS